MPIALANSPLPSERNSILPSAPVDFFQASITKASLIPVTAMVLTPLALNASMFLRKLGMCRLLQVGVKAPGTANSATFLPLKMSSVVFGLLGPSAVWVRNVALGNLSPTLMGMAVSSRVVFGGSVGWQNSLAGELVEVGGDLDGAAALDYREGQFE